MKQDSMLYKDEYVNNINIFLIITICIGFLFFIPLIRCTFLSSCDNYGWQGANYLFGIIGITIIVISTAILMYYYINKSNTEKNFEKKRLF